MRIVLPDAKEMAVIGRRLMGILARVLRQTTDVEAPCQVVRGHCQVHGYDTPCPVSEFREIAERGAP